MTSSDALALSRLETRLPPLLAVIAGMVDLTGFFALGNIFTAHITGNLVVVVAAVVRGRPFNVTQALAIPVAIAALACVWLIARISGRYGADLSRILLVVQFVMLVSVLLISVCSKASATPHSTPTIIAAMAAVSAMACQFAIFRLALPGAISTAVMTGNLTNAVLSAIDRFSRNRPLMVDDDERLKKSLLLLCGFLVGCGAAAIALPVLGDWTWSMPVGVAAIALMVR